MRQRTFYRPNGNSISLQLPIHGHQHGYVNRRILASAACGSRNTIGEPGAVTIKKQSIQGMLLQPGNGIAPLLQVLEQGSSTQKDEIIRVVLATSLSSEQNLILGNAALRGALDKECSDEGATDVSRGRALDAMRILGRAKTAPAYELIAKGLFDCWRNNVAQVRYIGAMKHFHSELGVAEKRNFELALARCAKSNISYVGILNKLRSRDYLANRAAAFSAAVEILKDSTEPQARNFVYEEATSDGQEAVSRAAYEVAIRDCHKRRESGAESSVTSQNPAATVSAGRSSELAATNGNSIKKSWRQWFGSFISRQTRSAADGREVDPSDLE